MPRKNKVKVAPKKQKKESPSPEPIGLVLLLSSLLALAALVSFSFGDIDSNWLGLVGYGFSWGLTYLFGIGSFLFLAFSTWFGWRLLLNKSPSHPKRKWLYFLLLLTALSVSLSAIAEESSLLGALGDPRVHLEIVRDGSAARLRHYLGGVPFYYLFRDLPSYNLHHLLSSVGTLLVSSAVIFASFLLLTGIRPRHVIERFKERERREPWLRPLLRSLLQRRRAPQLASGPPPEKKKKAPKQKKEKGPVIETEVKLPLPLPKIEKEPPPPPLEPARSGGSYPSLKLPEASLLPSAKQVDQSALKEMLLKRATQLEETLASFNIEAKVGEIHCGPTVIAMEVHPAVGVKVQRIKALENDIALNLKATGIRIIAPIPGKGAVGIEIPSPQPQEVAFRDMLENYQRSGSPYKIPLLLGKTVTGEDVMADLTRMPHMIIAGATGSGKSVCLNTIILSILQNRRPDEVRLLLIDPKKVELSGFSKVPHMIAPVITEPHEACCALNWLVKEMERRYELLKAVGVRNIDSFNNRERDAEREEQLEMEVPDHLCYMVGIVDELADLMMVSTSDIETPITRIAQMARAVGIHLILATQRPSREVITGLIKANFPTRISFKVSNRVNSQIILDEPGAEQLLGSGDMLFLPPGTSTLVRAQGAYLPDSGINKVVRHLCQQAPTDYLIESFIDQGSSDGGISGDDLDPLFDQAVELVVSTGNASTTFLQRKMKVGYARAASIMDQLEANRIVGPQDGARARRILVKREFDEEE